MSFAYYSMGRNPKSGLYQPDEYKYSGGESTYLGYKPPTYQDHIKSGSNNTDKKDKKKARKEKGKPIQSSFHVHEYKPTIEPVHYQPYILPNADPVTGKPYKITDEPKKTEVKKAKKQPLQKRQSTHEKRQTKVEPKKKEAEKQVIPRGRLFARSMVTQKKDQQQPGFQRGQQPAVNVTSQKKPEGRLNVAISRSNAPMTSPWKIREANPKGTQNSQLAANMTPQKKRRMHIKDRIW